MRSEGWGPKPTWQISLIRRGRDSRDAHTQRTGHRRTQQEGDCLQARGRPQEKPNLWAPWSYTSKPPELWDDTFLLFKPLSLWCFAMAAPADWHSRFGVGSRICLSDKFPDDADAVGLRTTCCDTLSWHIFDLSWRWKLTNINMVLPILSQIEWSKLSLSSPWCPPYFWGARFLSKTLTLDWEEKRNLLVRKECRRKTENELLQGSSRE